MNLEDIQKEGIKKTAERFRLGLIILFGSAVSEKVHTKSDIDIAVYSDKEGLSLKEYSELIEALSKIFPSKEIDLSFINHADPLFLKKILENCQLLYGPYNHFQQLKIYAFKRYQDHRRYFKMEEEFAERFIRTVLSER